MGNWNLPDPPQGWVEVEPRELRIVKGGRDEMYYTRGKWLPWAHTYDSEHEYPVAIRDGFHYLTTEEADRLVRVPTGLEYRREGGPYSKSQAATLVAVVNCATSPKYQYRYPEAGNEDVFDTPEPEYCECPPSFYGSIVNKYRSQSKYLKAGKCCDRCHKSINPVWTWKEGDPKPLRPPVRCEILGYSGRWQGNKAALDKWRNGPYRWNILENPDVFDEPEPEYCECEVRPEDSEQARLIYGNLANYLQVGEKCHACGKSINPVWTWDLGDPKPTKIPKGCKAWMNDGNGWEEDDTLILENWRCKRRWNILENPDVFDLVEPKLDPPRHVNEKGPRDPNYEYRYGNGDVRRGFDDGKVWQRLTASGEWQNGEYGFSKKALYRRRKAPGKKLMLPAGCHLTDMQCANCEEHVQWKLVGTKAMIIPCKCSGGDER